MLQASEKTAQIILGNWHRVREQVAEACLSASRDPAEVHIVGVSKYVGPNLAWQLFEAGCHILGENRPQSLWDKHEYFASKMAAADTSVPAPARWHLIGHLQRNKLRRTLPKIDCLQSLDSLRLAQAISDESCSLGIELPVLVEVNVTHDASKTGLTIEETLPFLTVASQLPGMRIRGLMAMSSRGANPASARSEFERVSRLRDELQVSLAGQLQLPELSMGMSGDFQQAIAAGATLVRIGSNLWTGVLEG